MAKKYIDVMDTTFRDGFESVVSSVVLSKDFLPAVEFAKSIGISHFEFGYGSNFCSRLHTLKENPFEVMQKFRVAAGLEANLQLLFGGIYGLSKNVVSSEVLGLFIKVLAKYETTTVRNYDALNDIRNLEYSSNAIVDSGMMNEIAIVIGDLPLSASSADSAQFYIDKVLDILDSGIPFDSIVFKDTSGTTNPAKIYEIIKTTRELLGDSAHIRVHTHDSLGIGVSCYLAALEAGVDGIDLALSPVSGGASQPDMLSMLHAVKGMGYNFGDLEPKKVLEYQEFLKNSLSKYELLSEAKSLNSLASFLPIPARELLDNLSVIKSNNIATVDELINTMSDVMQKGGQAVPVAPISTIYLQQLFSNIANEPWQKVTPNFGKLILGYFGKTPIVADPDIVELAEEQLSLLSTTKEPLDIADDNSSKSINFFRAVLEGEGISVTDENTLIIASCLSSGLKYLTRNMQ